MTWIAATDAVIDGEVVALDPDGAPSFELLQQRISGDPRVAEAPLVYMAFDLLHLDGRSLLLVPLEDRKRLLRSVLRDHARVRFAAHVTGDGKAFYEAAAGRGLEGVVAKERKSRYEPGRRSRSWLKIKARPEQELVVGGYIPGEGSARDLGALLVGVYEGDRLTYVGRVGSGLDGRTRSTLKKRLDALVRPTAPFDPPPARSGELREARFAEPEIVVRAEFAAWTREGTIRQSAFKGILDGRDPRAVARERAIASPTPASPPTSPNGSSEAAPEDPPAAKPARAPKRAAPSSRSDPSLPRRRTSSTRSPGSATKARGASAVVS